MNRRMLRRVVMALLAVLCAAPGGFASSTDTVVVCTGAGCDAYPDNPLTAPTLDAAIGQVRADSDIKTIWLPPGTYSSNINLTANDGGFSIIGLGKGTSGAAPTEVEVVAANGDEPVFNLTSVSSGIVIEGLTIKGGRYGVRVNGGGSGVIFNRCYITANTKDGTGGGGHGVWCTGAPLARPTFINCSISWNEGDGAHVEASGAPAGAAGAGAKFLNCTMLGNGDNGVFVASGAGARVLNSLVYGNNDDWGGTTPYEESFDDSADTGGFLADTDSEWAFNTPTELGGADGGNKDPAGGHTDSYVWGVDLAQDGDYEPNIDGADQYGAGGPVDDPNDIEEAASDVPVDIPDGARQQGPGQPTDTSAKSFLTFPVYPAPPTNHPLVVGDVNVLLDVEHPCLRELKVSLAHAGRTATLFNGSSVQLPGCEANLSETFFDDEASVQATSDQAPYHGVFKPMTELAAFDGVEARGEWTLILEDLVAGDTMLLDEQFDNPVAPPEPMPDWSSPDWQVYLSRPGDAVHGEYRNEGGTPISVYEQPGSEVWKNYQVTSNLRIVDPGAASGNKEFGIVFRYTGPQDYLLFRVRVGSDCADPSTTDTYCMKVGVYEVTSEGTASLGPEQEIDPDQFVTPGAGEHAVIDWNRQDFSMPANLTVDVSENTANAVATFPSLPVAVLDSGGSVVRSLVKQTSVTFQNVAALGHPRGTAGCYADNVQVGFEYVTVEGETPGILRSWSLQVEPVHYVTAAALDLSALADDETVGVSYWRWLNAAADSFAVLECSKDGVLWERLWSNREAGSAAITDNTWVLQSFDVSSVARDVTGFSSGFLVRWGYHAGAKQYSGWNVDDLAFKTDIGGGLVAAPGARPYGSHNCAYANKPFERVDFEDVAGALETDPGVPALWGAMPFGSPVTDAGSDSFAIDPYSKTDFEGEERSETPDIGADEAGGGVAGLGWYYCVVTPSPIGRLAAGGLTVWIRTSAELYPIEVFIVPKGVTEADYAAYPDRFIRIVETTYSAGNWWGTNADRIDTILPDVDADGFEVVVDGDAHVAMRFAGAFVDPVGQAVAGRQVLIDTTPPALALAFPPPGALPSTAFVSHPSGIPDAGVIASVPDGFGASWFSSYASLLQPPLPPSQNHNLDIVVSAVFLDPPVSDSSGYPVPGRAVSGFGEGSPVAGSASEILGGRTIPPPPAQWVWPMPGTADQLAGLKIAPTYIVGAGLDTLEASWRIYDTYRVSGVPDFPGIPWIAAANNGYQYHLEIQFVAQDLAGNRTLDDQTLLLDPVHVWWLLNTQVELKPQSPQGAEFAVTDAKLFHWRLLREENPVTVVAPKPLFSYRLWASVYDGKLPEFGGPYEGPYEPVTDWEPWVPWDPQVARWAEMREEFLSEVEPDITGRYVLLVVQGQDEAANVTPFPPAGLAERNDGSGWLDVVGPAGLDWTRFFVGTSSAGIVDTRIAPSFAYLDSDGNPVKQLGAPAVVPLPAIGSGQSLVATMQLGYIVPPPGGFPEIAWEFEAPGLAALLAEQGLPFDPADWASGVVDDADSYQVQLTFPPGFVLKKPLNCVFRAAASGDTTPAAFSFTVTSSSGSLIDPKDQKDHQPIVIRSQEGD